jgi:4-diphosphocytidyl-2-C-methyl-D-erythritol kinase
MANNGPSTGLTFHSPAKVNLFLKVLSKRADGYHNISSLVSPISLFDVMHIRERDDGQVVVRDDKALLPEGNGNTIYRAAMLMKRVFRIDRGVEVFVEKRIPIGAGLGGPSSNAATVIKGLDSLWRLSLDAKTLMALGARIGADVPLFVYGGPCLIAGIGEKVTPLFLPHLWLVIVYPGVVLKTGDVYEGLNFVLTKGENEVTLATKVETIYDVARLLENDLEKVGIPLCPIIRSIKEKLVAAGAVGALMSGSGSSAFGLFENREAAERASVAVGQMGTVFVAQSIGS